MSISVPGPVIALVGGPETGKTVLLTVLVHELMHRLGNELDIAITWADDPTMEWFVNAEDSLYRQFSMPARDQGESAPENLMFRLTLTERPAFRRKRPRHVLLTFIEIAGSYFDTDSGCLKAKDWLTTASAIVLLLDPSQPPGTPDAAGLLERITDLARGDGDPAGKLAKPLAITVSKLDVMCHALKETSPLRRPPPGHRFFDEGDSQEVHIETSRLLSRWDAAGLSQVAQASYSRYRCFGVSALGCTPATDKEVSPHGIQPYRAADPFLWLLAAFGVIPAKRGG